MRFLVDDQLPVALARWLTANGCEAEHVYDIGLTGATDRKIWEVVKLKAAVMVTKDSDFLNLQWQLPGPPVVLLTMGNCSKAKLINTMEKNLAQLLAALGEGEVLIEIR